MSNFTNPNGNGRQTKIETKDTNYNHATLETLPHNEKLIHNNQRYWEIITEIADQFLESDQPHELIAQLCRKLMEFLDCHVFFQYLVDEKKGCWRLNAYAGVPEDTAQKLQWLNFQTLAHGCVSHDGARFLAEKLQETEDPGTAQLKAWGIRAFACHPLKVRNEVIGAVSFGTRSRDSFNPSELMLMKALASQLAFVINQSRVEELLQYQANLVENVSDAIIATDAAFKIKSWNQGAKRIYGWTAHEAIGHDAGQLLNTRLIYGTPEETINHLLEKGHFQIETTHQSKDGRRLYVIGNLSLIRNNKGEVTGTVGIFRDITGQKRVENLNRALNKINEFIHSSLDFDEVMNRTLTEAAQALGCETAFISLRNADHWTVPYSYGFSKETIGTRMNEGQDLHALMAIMTKKPVVVNDAFHDERVNLEQIKEWDVRSIMVVPLITEDQVAGVLIFNAHQQVLPFEQPHIDFASKLATSISLALTNLRLIEKVQEELAERKKVEQELAYAMQRINAHMDNTPLGVVEFDSKFQVIRWSPEAERIFGWSAMEILGKSVSDLRWICKDDIGPVSEMAASFFDGQISRNINRNRYYHKDGSIVYCEWYNSAIFDTNGKLSSILSFALDVTKRCRVEQALKASEDRLKTIYEHAAVGINTVNLSGRYLQVNRKFCEMSGYSQNELLKLATRDLFDPDDLLREEGYIRKLVAGEISSYTFETRLYGRRRQGVWVNLTVSLVKNENESGYFIQIVEDISVRKQMEDALQCHQNDLIAANQELQAQTEVLNSAYLELQRQAAEIREYAEAEARARYEAERRAAELDATISSIAAGVIIYDNTGKIVRMNELARKNSDNFRFNNQLAFPEWSAGLNIRAAGGAPYTLEETPLYRALEGEIIHEEEMILFTDAGQPIWFSATFAPIRDTSQNIIGVISIFTDITERKRQVEDRLASERELLKVTLNSLAEGVVATDGEERIILINQAAASLTGYSADEVIGQPLSKILYVLDDQTSEPLPVATSFKGHPILVTRDLKEVPIAISSTPIKDPGENIIGTVTVFYDITEKQKTERELLKADKLESLGILAGGIAHDFNNILAAILANVQLALIKSKKNEDIEPYLINTVETTRKASDLTKQLLTFSKGGAPVKKDASLINLIKDTTEFVLRGSRVKAEFAIPDNLWIVSIDEAQISQVIHNLVINAEQAMPKGGAIQIYAENITIEPDSHYHPGNYVKITFKDQGIGIKKEHLPKIFDPFFTTKKDGNGLGLATSYSIIKRHNGYIEVESWEDIGTIFVIYLPATTTPALPAPLKKTALALGTGFKILLMDDEEAILSAVSETLSSGFGYQVVPAADGATAIALYQEAKKSGKPFDAVIMDLTVPGGMGGQEAVAILRDFDPKIKAIVSSGYANNPIMADYKRYGFAGVVSKPYKIDELNEVLQKIIESPQLPLKFTY
ncbi:MAG: PAS domain S-box protein [Firmicutes bacterium]|nr:PAS domain S-box protein [Bacillota bacterium]